MHEGTQYEMRQSRLRVTCARFSSSSFPAWPLHASRWHPIILALFISRQSTKRGKKDFRATYALSPMKKNLATIWDTHRKFFFRPKILP